MHLVDNDLPKANKYHPVLANNLYLEYSDNKHTYLFHCRNRTSIDFKEDEGDPPPLNVVKADKILRLIVKRDPSRPSACYSKDTTHHTMPVYAIASGWMTEIPTVVLRHWPRDRLPFTFDAKLIDNHN